MKKIRGILPCRGWLIANGYNGLDKAIIRYPAAFAHIRQDRKRCRLVDKIHMAEVLARKHGGVLPNRGWLQKNGYATIIDALSHHPTVFAHIQQDRTFHTIDEWVYKAGQLAMKHGGILPNPNWLQKNGYNTLYAAMRRAPHPSLTSHREVKEGAHRRNG